MIFLDRTHFNMMRKSTATGIAHEKMFALVLKCRIVSNFIDSYDESEPGLKTRVRCHPLHNSTKLSDIALL